MISDFFGLDDDRVSTYLLFLLGHFKILIEQLAVSLTISIELGRFESTLSHLLIFRPD